MYIPLRNCFLMANSISVAQPIRLQHLLSIIIDSTKYGLGCWKLVTLNTLHLQCGNTLSFVNNDNGVPFSFRKYF